jgi:hypothetical protein
MLGLKKKVRQLSYYYYKRRTVTGDQRWEGEKERGDELGLVIFIIYYLLLAYRYFNMRS